ncbi:MAG TPA: iron uptake transporter deferrochelatase/peroxidase subunit [Acidimicrobiales bacterium]
MTPRRPGAFSRRQMLAGSGLATAALVTGAGVETAAADTLASGTGATEPFHGAHQGGIATAQQARMAFAAFDVTGTDRAALTELLVTWTRAAEQMTRGRDVAGPSGSFAPPADTGEALDLPASRLTLTVGYGPSLFDGRFGLAARRPRSLIDLPAFPGDALDPARSGGDLCVQACADDPQVAFHAIHNLTRLGLGTVSLRHLQLGFGRTAAAAHGASSTPRNLLGFKDGTDNIAPSDAGALDKFVWVGGSADQSWMQGGTYLVARRIRVHLEAWDRSTLGDQERTIGRAKTSGAPLGSAREHDPVDLKALDDFGAPRIPDSSHIRAAAPTTNHGATILRRGYSFVDGVDPSTGELDAGLFFVCFQQDPSEQFVRIQRRLAAQDALTTYLVHTGSGVFACPRGPGPGRPWGHGLL